MKLFEIYRAMIRSEISHDEAAEQFGITPRDLKFRLTKYGKRMPRVLKTLDKIQEDRMDRTTAAETLGVSLRQVNNLMESWGVQRPLKEYLVDRAVSEVKWEIRKKFAIEYISGSCTIEEAAENAGVSTRQIRRWVSELLAKHYEIVFKDLKHIPLSRLRRMADEIEEKEGLEVAKQNVLREVLKGETAIEEVALQRVMSRRTRARPLNVRRE
jgi:hypothetical protein